MGTVISIRALSFSILAFDRSEVADMAGDIGQELCDPPDGTLTKAGMGNFSFGTVVLAVFTEGSSHSWGGGQKRVWQMEDRRVGGFCTADW